MILIIGDGMGYAHQVAASRYRYGIDRGLSFHRFPEQAYVTTWSVDSYNAYADAQVATRYSRFGYEPGIGYDPDLGGYAPYPMLPEPSTAQDYFTPGGVAGPYTDSAASATAMATGFKTVNAFLGKGPEEQDLETSLERVRRLYGMATGVITTVPVSHATPGGFASHVNSRNNYHEIAHQMVTVTRPDVVIGAGFIGTDPTFIAQADLDTLKTSPDWVYVQRADDKDGGEALRIAATSAAQQNKKLWGMFGHDSYGFERPVAIHSPDNPTIERPSTLDPTLPQASTAALHVLSQREEGFFLMIEQGTIDSSCHEGDYARMVGCVWELDDTVNAVLDYVNRPDDAVDWSNTTVFVVADHETGFLRFSGAVLGKGELTSDAGTYSWTGSHSNQLVTLSAIGAYAHRWKAYANQYSGRPILDNTSIFALTLDASER